MLVRLDKGDLTHILTTAAYLYAEHISLWTSYSMIRL